MPPGGVTTVPSPAGAPAIRRSSVAGAAGAPAGAPGATTGVEATCSTRTGSVDEHSVAGDSEQPGDPEHERGALGRPDRRSDPPGEGEVRGTSDHLVDVVDGDPNQSDEIGIGEHPAVVVEPCLERRRPPAGDTPGRRADLQPAGRDEAAGEEHRRVEAEPGREDEGAESPEAVDESLGGAVALRRLDQG